MQFIFESLKNTNVSRTFFSILLLFVTAILPFNMAKGQCPNNSISTTWNYSYPDGRIVPLCTPLTFTATVCNYGSSSVNVSLNIAHPTGNFAVLQLNELQNCGITNGNQKFCSSTVSLGAYSCKTYTFILQASGSTPGSFLSIGGFFTINSTNCPLPTQNITGGNVSVIGQTGQNTNFSQFTGGSSFIPDKLLIKGNVTLNVDHTVLSVGTAMGYIAFDENAKLTIPNGKTLTLRGANVHGCVRRWNSITVEAGGTVLSRPKDILEFSGNTTIKDAENAIIAKEESVINVAGTNFIDNVKGIFAPPPTNASTLSQTAFTPLHGCTFMGTGLMKPAAGSGLVTPIIQNPKVGIELQRVSGIDIHSVAINTSAGATRFRTVFKSMANGIITKGTYLNIEGSYFDDISSAYGTSATPNDIGNGILQDGDQDEGFWLPLLVKSDFNNCNNAINVTQTPYTIIENSTIDNLYFTDHYGIRLVNNSGYFSIRNNTITAGVGIGSLNTNLWTSSSLWNSISDNTIRVKHSNRWLGIGAEVFENGSPYSWNVKDNLIALEQGHDGLFFNSANMPNVVGNQIDLLIGATSYASGIETSGTFGMNAACNVTTNNSAWGPQNRRGIAVYGTSNSTVSCNRSLLTNSGLLAVGTCTNTQFQGNNLANNNIGLLYANNTQTGPQSHNGNKWILGNATGAIHLGGAPEAVLSPYTVSSSIQPLHPITVSPSTWFSVQSGTTYTCQATNDCPQAEGIAQQPQTSVNPLNRALMTTTETTGMTKEMKWTMQRHLYRYAIEKPAELTQDPKLKEFYDKMAVTSVSKMSKLEKNLKFYHVEGKLNKDKITATLSSYEDLRKQYAEAADWVYKQEDVKKTDANYKKMLSIWAQITKLNSGNESELKTIEKSKKLVVTDNTLRENETITTVLLPESNEKEINRVSIQLILKPNTVLDATQKEIVTRIAHQCPTAGGDAVYRARSLYRMIESKRFDDLDICGSQMSLIEDTNAKIASISSNGNYKVYPNPVKDFLTVELPQNTEGGAWLIYNTLGEIVKRFNVTERNLDVRALSKGIYFIHFEAQGKDQFSQKFVKID
jgi:Secretion system C-terminal sorting domain